MLFIFVCAPSRTQDNTAPPGPGQNHPSVLIRWDGQPKIERYRLQLARDEAFSDIVFDRIVMGREYTVMELDPGKYFWRVAPSAGETGKYSPPLPVEISYNNSGAVVTGKVLTPPADVGWRTATGNIREPVAARLRGGENYDLVGVNSYGAVYAINGANGVALWTARYRPDAKKGEATNSDGAPQFKPVVVEIQGKPLMVVVAYESGVRALDGASGRELWRAKLPGEAVSGLALDATGEGATTLAIVDNSGTLSFLKAENGESLSQAKVEGLAVGSPIAYDENGKRGVLLALNKRLLDMRNAAGASLLAVRLDVDITTGPLLIKTARETLLMLGTEHGLVAFNAVDLKPLWRIVTEDDSPQGSLAAKDLDADGTEEVVMATRRGRIVAINVETRKIKWYAEGALDAEQVTFADVNGDSAMDVLVPAGPFFAVGFSGRDGSLIWKSDDGARASQNKGTGGATVLPLRALVAAPFGGDGVAFVVGTDSEGTGLRAVGLPLESVKLSRTDSLRPVDKQ